MRRREFIRPFGSTTVLWPLAASAPQPAGGVHSTIGEPAHHDAALGRTNDPSDGVDSGEQKKIVLLSDGTGNSAAKAQKTNVWRLFQALDRKKLLFAKYDDGVGTSSNKYLAILGGAFGWGLKRNVLDLYKFVCRNYKRGDEIYGFGFSRGAFTIRVVVGLIDSEGLVHAGPQEQLDHYAAAAYRRYRSKAFSSRSPIVFLLRHLRDGILRVKDWATYHRTYSEIQADSRRQINIRFLGLWDTVEAYGIPIATLKRGIDLLLWPMKFRDFKCPASVKRACHALSLDDERTPFHPLLWDEAADGRITQVWFAGVHSNVGGGYPEDNLSLVPLVWIMKEAQACELPLDEKSVQEFAAESSPFARLYDSRTGLAAYYPYDPRQIPMRNPIVHGSVIMRMVYGPDQYAPIILPDKFDVMAPDGTLLPMPLETQKESELAKGPVAESKKSELVKAMQLLSPLNPTFHSELVTRVWDTVWWRRVVYYVTVLFTLILLASPLTSGKFAQFAYWFVNYFGIADKIDRAAGQSDIARSVTAMLDKWNAEWGGFISPPADALGGSIPYYATPWKNALLRHPVEVSWTVLAIMVCLYANAILRYRICDRARIAWHRRLAQDHAAWIERRRRGERRGMFVLLAVLLLIGFLVSRAPLVEIGSLGGIAVLLVLAILWRGTEAVSTTKDSKTFALRIARWLRTRTSLTWLYVSIRDRVGPITFALGLIVAVACLGNRVLFDGWSSAGQVCESSIKEAQKEEMGTKDFALDSLCWPTGLVLTKGARYHITVTIPDRRSEEGFLTNITPWLKLPLRRWWTQNWFQPIAQIDTIGNDQYVLESSVPQESSMPNTGQEFVTAFTARNTGELFIFVNDAVLILPGNVDLFYRHNKVMGTVTVKRGV
jgi:uncharacterized protein (DUF2235 family)